MKSIMMLWRSCARPPGSPGAQEPEVEIKGTGTYTLMLVDVDSPSPKDPHHRSFLLWMVINIPAVDIARGEVVEEYSPPSPARGKHRYAFLLFKQSKRLVVRPPSKRHSFQVGEAASSERPAGEETRTEQPRLSSIVRWQTDDDDNGDADDGLCAMAACRCGSGPSRTAWATLPRASSSGRSWTRQPAAQYWAALRGGCVVLRAATSAAEE